MQYIICPRCHFRLAPTAHICRTCGQAISPARKESSDSQTQNAAASVTAAKKGTWKNVFSFGDSGEKRHDDHALGET